MLDIFKGAAVTLVVWALTIRIAPVQPAIALFWGLPVISFVLPLRLPNGRWLFGSAALAMVIVALAFADSDGSFAAAIAIGLFGCACVATFMGIAARYVFRGLRAWHRKRTNAPSLPEKELPPITRRSVVLTVGSALGLFVAYAVFVLFFAGASAKQIAAGRPYCIEIASGDGLRSVRSRLELLGFYMMSDGRTRHALLAVKNRKTLETFHWSYRNNAFRADEYGPQPVHCIVAPDFLAHPRGQAVEAGALRQ